MGDAKAVITLLGPLRGSKGNALRQGMANIIAAMKKHGVRRLIATSTLSASNPNDRCTTSLYPGRGRRNSRRISVSIGP